MTLINNFPDKLCEWFSDMREFSECSFCTYFPKDSQAYPLTKPIIVFGFQSIKITDDNENEVNTTTMRTATEEFCIDINIPRLNSGTKGAELLDKILNMILFGLPIRITGVETETIKYDRNTDSLVIRTIFSIKEVIQKDSIIYPKPPAI